MPDQYDMTIDAVHAVRAIHAHHGASPLSALQAVNDVAAMLRARAANHLEGKPNGLALAIADTIARVGGTKRD